MHKNGAALKRFLLTCVLAAPAWPGGAHAADEPPYPTRVVLANQSPRATDSLRLACERAGPTLKCGFARAAARYQLGHAEKAQKLADARKRLADGSPIDPAVFTKLCTDDLRAKLSTHPTPQPSETPSLEYQQLFAAATLCTKRDGESLLQYLDASYTRQTRTCIVEIDPWQESFELQRSGQWFSKSGAQGECGISRLSTLDYDRTRKDVVWVYESKQVVTKREAPACQSQVDATVRFGAEPIALQMDCAYLLFGQ